MKIGRHPEYAILPEGGYLFASWALLRFGYRTKDRGSWRAQVGWRTTPSIEIFRAGYLQREVMFGEVLTSFTYRRILGVNTTVYTLGDGEATIQPPARVIPGTGAPYIPGKVPL